MNAVRNVQPAADGTAARLGADRVRLGYGRHLVIPGLSLEVPPGGWEIHVLRDPDDELARGQIGIVSTLAMPAPPDWKALGLKIRLGENVIVQPSGSPGAQTSGIRTGTGIASP